MIDWDKVERTDLDDIVLRKEPYLLFATQEEVERRIQLRDEQVGFWQQLFDDWEQQGIIISAE